MKSSLRNMILSLTGLTVAIGAALAVVNEATADAIKETARRSRIEAMKPYFEFRQRFHSPSGACRKASF